MPKSNNNNNNNLANVVIYFDILNVCQANIIY